MAKNRVTNPKKDKKEKTDVFKTEKKRKKGERERSFLNRNAFLFFSVYANFD